MTNEAKIEAMAQTATEFAGIAWEVLPDAPDAACGHGMPEGCKNYWRGIVRAVLPIATADVVPRAVPDDVTGLLDAATLRMKNAENYSDAAHIAISSDVRLIGQLATALTALASTVADLERQLAEARS